MQASRTSSGDGSERTTYFANREPLDSRAVEVLRWALRSVLFPTEDPCRSQSRSRTAIRA